MEKNIKFFNHNTSFSLIRTNPILSGNIKITIFEDGKANLNSINANSILSSNRFKRYNITGENSYANDLYNFLDEGNLDNDIIFEVSKKTNGDKTILNDFSKQYDFFYGQGAITTPDKGFYKESFSYFAPIWLRDEIPEYFVIFKIPDPVPYSYHIEIENNGIEVGKKYKIYDSLKTEVPFCITYGTNEEGEPLKYYNGDTIIGSELYGKEFFILEGEGKVILLDELYNKDKIDDTSNLFSTKILPNANVIKTFDLREGTLIGNYLRNIIKNNKFKNGPIEINFGKRSYSYYYGIDYKNGTYTKTGELMYDFLSSPESNSMIPFENYITSGFYRNSLICQNLINLEFLFDDPSSETYTINRYFGMYVSRNDLAKFRMDGNAFFVNREDEGNNNKPVPRINNIGYFDKNIQYKLKSENGVRLYYDKISGWIPGSDDINIQSPNSLFYILDKKGNFKSLKRFENYDTNNPDHTFGSFDGQLFLKHGDKNLTKGNLLLADKNINLKDLTGVDDFIGSPYGKLSHKKGCAYVKLEFSDLNQLDKLITIKLYWPGGKKSDEIGSFDIINGIDYSGSIEWTNTSFYNREENKAFNINSNNTDVAKSFSNLMNDFSNSSFLTIPYKKGTVIIKSLNEGEYNNKNFQLSIFDNYEFFETKFKGIFNKSMVYYEEDIIINEKNEYKQYKNGEWVNYYTFNSKNYIKINDIDINDNFSNISFIGGTDSNNRIIFKSSDSKLYKINNYIATNKGYQKIISINDNIDEIIKDDNGEFKFINFENTKIAVIEDQYSLPLLDGDKAIISKAVNLSLGIFSFYPIKDFNFDFWSSEYSYVPFPEVYRYYNLRPNTKNAIKPNIYYLVKSGSIEYMGNVYHQGQSFRGNEGNSIFKIISNKKSKKTNVVPIPFLELKYKGTSHNYEDKKIKIEDNLDTFRGFYGIESIINDSLTKRKSEEKHELHLNSLKTEYEYLKENYNIKYSNISRIVPYINKWAMYSGTDARGNPYRLNASPAFSPTNFSPSLDIYESDPKYLTHEGYLLEKIPWDYPIEYINEQKDYLPDAPNYELLRNANTINESYFEDFFTVSPERYIENIFFDKGANKEFFTPLIYNESTGFYETLFRGIKYIFKRNVPFTKTGSDEPKSIKEYRGFEGYKFTSVLRVEKETDKIQSPVAYEFIENSTQKFIMLVITVIIDDFRTRELTINTEGSEVRLDRVLLYTLKDKKKLFNQTNGQAQNKIDDIKLSASLDLSYTSKSYVDNLNEGGKIFIINNPEYDTDLREEIHKLYPKGADRSIWSEGNFFAPHNGSIYPWPIGVSKNYIEFDKIAGNYLFHLPFTGLTGEINIPIGSKMEYENIPIYQKSGGNNYYRSIISRISMAQIAKKINEENKYIKYNSYFWNKESNKTDAVENLLSVNIEEPLYFRKTEGQYPVPSREEPKNINTNEIKSYTIKKSKKYQSDILRYSGFYEPLFNDIITFKNKAYDVILDNIKMDLNLRNTQFSPNRQNFGIIKNLNYTKINPTENILNKTSNTINGSVYPLIDETPIDRKDFSVFNSSWDPGYYNLYTSVKNKIILAGTRSMKENKSFFGSKIMQVPSIISVNNFISMEVSKKGTRTDISVINDEVKKDLEKIQNLNHIDNLSEIGQYKDIYIGTNFNKMDEDLFPEVEIFWERKIDPFNPEQVLYINGIIRGDRILRRYFLNSGIKKHFTEFILEDYGIGNTNSIEEDIYEYIKLNLFPLFKVSNIITYKKDIEEEKELMVRGDVLPFFRDRLGYIKDNNFKLNKKDDLIFYFEYKVDSQNPISLNFGIDIEKI